MNNQPRHTRNASILGVVGALAVVAAILAGVLLNRESPPPAASQSASASPSAGASLNQELLSQRLTVLVIGTDSSPARPAQGLNTINTASTILASIHPEQPP